VARPSPPPGLNFSAVRDIVIAPGRAFASIEERPSWTIAYGVVVLITISGFLLAAPAILHVMLALNAANPEVTARPAADLMNQARLDLASQALSSAIAPLLMWNIAAMSVALSLRSDAPLAAFPRLLALNAFGNIPSALGTLAFGIGLRLHSAGNFTSVADLYHAVPLSLAAFAPHADERQLSFLAFWDPWQLWSLILIGYGYAAFLKLNLTIALALSFSIGLVYALFITLST
jgi:hypothetical protein